MLSYAGLSRSVAVRWMVENWTKGGERRVKCAGCGQEQSHGGQESQRCLLCAQTFEVFRPAPVPALEEKCREVSRSNGVPI